MGATAAEQVHATCLPPGLGVGLLFLGSSCSCSPAHHLPRSWEVPGPLMWWRCLHLDFTPTTSHSLVSSCRFSHFTACNFILWNFLGLSLPRYTQAWKTYTSFAFGSLLFSFVRLRFWARSTPLTPVEPGSAYHTFSCCLPLPAQILRCLGGRVCTPPPATVRVGSAWVRCHLGPHLHFTVGSTRLFSARFSHQARLVICSHSAGRPQILPAFLEDPGRAQWFRPRCALLHGGVTWGHEPANGRILHKSSDFRWRAHCWLLLQEITECHQAVLISQIVVQEGGHYWYNFEGRWMQTFENKLFIRSEEGWREEGDDEATPPPSTWNRLSDRPIGGLPADINQPQ